MNSIRFIFLLFLLPMFLNAQKITISGTAQSYPNKEIGLWAYQDRISNLQKQITLDTIETNGTFALEFLCKDIELLTLKIGKHITSMYVQPNTNYEVIIAAPDSTTYQNPNIEHDVNISIKQVSKTEINALTMDYDNRFDEFLGVTYLRIKSQAKIDSFKVAMKEFYSSVNNSFFKDYINYSIASLEQKTLKSEKKLFTEYLANKPILYSHPEYMNFFNSFYKQKLQTLALGKKGNDLPFIINDRGSFTAAASALKRDLFIPNDTIAELVLLKGLYESYYDGSFKRNGVTAILEQMAKESLVPEHKQIAQNILNSFSKLQKGTLAPGFELPDKTGLTHSLDEFRAKKYVYVMFGDETCTACMEQLKVIPSLKKTYGERIEFVSILNFKTNEELKNFQQKNLKYDWTFLYDNTKGDELKKQYEIRSFPSYFLISPEGKFIQVPAESPAGDIERVFYELTKVKSKLHGVGNKQNR